MNKVLENRNVKLHAFCVHHLCYVRITPILILVHSIIFLQFKLQFIRMHAEIFLLSVNKRHSFITGKELQVSNVLVTIKSQSLQSSPIITRFLIYRTCQASCCQEMPMIETDISFCRIYGCFQQCFSKNTSNQLIE